METKRIKIDELACDPANVRAHDGKNLDAIKGSLQRFGQQKPIVVDEKGIVIAGNGTLTAARALGWDAINIVRTELAGAEATAYAIADNRTAELAEWDDEALAKQLSALQIEDEALVEAAGFTDAELTALVDEVTGITEGNTDPDEVPEVPEEPTAQRGQTWQLGNHRLMCGDSTSADDVAALMDGQKADMVFTDPPYGISVVGSAGTVGGGGLCKANEYEKVIGDDSTDTALQVIEILKTLEIETLIFWGANYYADALENKASWIIWDKRGEMTSNNFADCELAWCSSGSPARIYRQVWSGMIKEGESGKRIHPTQKPIGLAAWCFENYGKPQSVIDLFLGSGSTLIACEQTGRKCYGMELSPAYCDVIIKRWEDFTGQTAEIVNG